MILLILKFIFNTFAMISDYYNRQFSLEKMNAKSIKLKSNQANIQPFMIPDSHFHPNSKMYEQLKSKC